mgnify:CR=1 FL=1
MSNKVLITNEQNAVKVPSGLRILIRRSCNAVLEYENFDGPAEISVTFVDNARIHELNKQYRDKDAPTDVLSFPMAENGEYDIDEDNGCKILGDIVISMERAMEQAELYGHSLQREVAYLTVHCPVWARLCLRMARHLRSCFGGTQLPLPPVCGTVCICRGAHGAH